MVAGLAGLLLGGLAMFGIIDAATPDYALATASFSHFWSNVARPFLLSPGFGGAAAFIAAAVTFFIAKERLDFDRTVRAEESRDERWWNLFDKLIEDESMFQVSDAGGELAKLLQESAQTPLQEKAVLVLLELYVGTGDDEQVVPEGGSSEQR
ncbi:hypothetical protein [Kineococcus sp. SYSU DK003]|uniref:hypothetical protein n=1 Tax=Kineococcus sp. SYSU DK003 TaxID=3383124 RepID=UPI003D7EC474